MKRTYISPETYIDAETLEQAILTVASPVGNNVYDDPADDSVILSRNGDSLWDDEED